MAYLNMAGARALTGMGSGPWDTLNWQKYGEACYAQNKAPYNAGATEVMQALQNADQVIMQAESTLAAARPSYEALVRDPSLEERVFEVQGFMPELEGAEAKVRQSRSQLGAVGAQFSSLIKGHFAGGGCAFVTDAGKAAEFASQASGAATAAANAVKGIPARVNELANLVSGIKKEKQQAAQAQAQSAAAAARADAMAAAQAQADADAASRADAAARAAQIEADREQRQFELTIQREELAARLARETAERDRIAQEAQLRRDAEERALQLERDREERAYLAEQRRLAMEEEGRLRAEERELRSQEREAELKRLLLLQELASSGLPTQYAPPGATAVPVAPPAAFPGWGVAPQGPSPFVPPGAVAPTAPPQQYQPMPGPSPYQQSAPGQAPSGPSPIPGFQWSAFDPGAEMFGLGAPVSSGNPTLIGAQVEEGYVILGPTEHGTYQFRGPDGNLLFQKRESEMYQPIYHGNRLIYYPPEQRPASGGDTAAITASIAQVLAAGAGAAGNVFAERERRKAIEAQVKAGFPQQQSYFPTTFNNQSGGGWGPVLIIGSLGLGAVILAVAKNKKSKKSA